MGYMYLQVISTRNSASFDVKLSFMNILNGGFWSVYGLVTLDWFIAAPNMVGMGVGVLQVICIAIFPQI